MATKVKAIIPEGEAVQLQIDMHHSIPRIHVPAKAPTWFRNWVYEAEKEGYYFRFGYVPLQGPRGNHWMTGATAGSWIIRGNDGQIMAIPPEHFEWFYNRTEEDQQHENRSR